jgi:hypothetical protein
MDIVIVSKFQSGDYISIVDILVTIIIAIWISIFVNKNFTTIRAVKEYFITENKLIKDEYNDFLDKIFRSNFKPSEVQEWFKIMTMKLDVLERYLKKEFKVHPKLLKHHNKMKILITGSEELNSNYKEQSFSLSIENRVTLHNIHKDFSSSQTRLVVEINKAKRK